MRHLASAAALLLLPAFTVAEAQEKVVVTPPSITVEGIPPIPQSIADGLARYAQFRQAQLQAWHPTKRQLLITTALGPVNQIHLVDGPGRDRRQLTWYSNGVPGPGGALSAPSFDPADGNVFVFQYDPAGTQMRSLYRYDLSTGEISLASQAKVRFSHVWSRQGSWIAFDSAERSEKDRDLYVMQPADPASKRRLAEFEGAWSPQDWSPDGSTLLANEVFANAETYLWRVDVKTGAKTALTPRDGEKAGWYNARFSSDGKQVYATSDRSGEWRIWRCALAACKWTPVTPDGLAVDTPLTSSFEISPDGQMLAATIDRGSTTELQVFDLGTLKARALPAIPRGLVSQIRWRPGSREVGFTVQSVRTQGDVYSVDASLGTLTRWTASETSFNADALPPPEVLEWKSEDGQVISGILYRPAAKFTGSRPVLVQIHGGPDTRARADFRGRSNYLLNELGIAIVYPNVRGSDGFGRKFKELDNGKGRVGAIKDIGALLDLIGGRADLDKTRVVLAGPSYGGWLALQAGIVYNDRIRGIIEGAGITDIVTFLEQTQPARQENRRQEFGDERDPDMRAFLTSISPLTRAAELKKPTFILHPGKDTSVPVAQARELLKALKANNATVWYAEFSDANHDNFPTTAANNDWMLASWILFLKTFALN
jgi:dipeptidyl aminopeptidase/acylaminoacyl peptidase